MIAEIIAIGSELITGSTTNTNAQYLSRKLLELGIEVKYHTAIEDDFNLLMDVFNLALNRADLIITTGGLGPTEDDLTKEAISTALGLELKLDLNMKQHIQNIFCNTKRKMTENNLKQALKPAGAEFLENSIGTAPGIFIQQDKKKIILLPGPPREVRLMFENQVVPQLRSDYNILTRSVNLVGIGESQVETRLMELDLDPINTRFATFARD
ncbi:MAG TPA: molybdopterin-binding protein, partial [Tissierellaceae bacterium]|nr:molybdopterin-binding protein [Tissierellaceae bacterium]